MQEASLRKRGKFNSDYTSLGSSVGLSGDSAYNHSWKFPLFRCLVCTTIGFGILFGIAILSNHRFPTPILLNEISKNPGVFVGERAFKHLERLTSIGPRVAGSYENEVLAVDLLMREINFIKHFSNPVHQITVDLQKPSGVLTPVAYGFDHNTIYQSLANVVVKIEGKNTNEINEEALLINAHFDSVHGSPGLYILKFNKYSSFN